MSKASLDTATLRSYGCEEVAADCEANAFAFGFLWCVSGDDAQIRDRFSAGDCTFRNEFDGFRARRNFWVNAGC